MGSTAQISRYSLIWWNWSSSQTNKDSSIAQIAQSFLNGWSSPNDQTSLTGSTSISSLIGLSAQAAQSNLNSRIRSNDQIVWSNSNDQTSFNAAWGQNATVNWFEKQK